MIKKVICILLFCFLFSSNAFAEKNAVLTIDDLDKKVETSITVKQFDITKSKLEKSQKDLLDFSKKILYDYEPSFMDAIVRPPMAFGPVIVYFENYPIYSYSISNNKYEELEESSGGELVPYTLDTQVKFMNTNKEILKNNLKLGAKQLFYNINITDQMIKLQQKVFEISNRQYLMGKEKYEVGMISESEYKNLQLKKSQEQLKLNSQKRLRSSLVLNLNNLLGIDYADRYNNLKENFEYKPFKVYNQDLLFKKALNNRYEVLIQKENVAKKNSQLNFAKKYFSNQSDSYLNVSIIQKELDKEKEKLEKVIEDTINELEVSIETINENYNKVKRDEDNFKIVEIKYKANKEKYDLGYFTKDLLELSEVEMMGAKINLMRDIASYKMSLEKFDGAINVGPKFN